MAKPDLPEDALFDTWLAESYRAARQAWPALQVPADAFAAHVRDRVGTLQQPTLFRQLRTDDLYLALACIRRERQAIASFEQALFPKVRRALLRMRLDPSAAQDIEGWLRLHLFTEEVPGRSLLTEYTGRGDLVSWLRATAIHAGLRLRRRQGRDAPLDSDLALPAPEADPELFHLKRQYGPQFQKALAHALSTLTPQARTLLRQRYWDRLGIDALARVHQVHRSTAARWLAAARSQVLGAVREDLATRLGLGPSEVESVLRLVPSQLDESISQLLRR